MIEISPPVIEYTYSGFALNGGAAINVPTAGTYVSVATGLNKRALCYVKVQNVSGGTVGIVVRDKDETGDWDNDKGEGGGCCRTYCDDNSYGAVVVPCNASGDIEITSSANDIDWKLWLMGFIPSI